LEEKLQLYLINKQHKKKQRHQLQHQQQHRPHKQQPVQQQPHLRQKSQKQQILRYHLNYFKNIIPILDVK